METTPKHTGKQVGLAVLNLIFVLLTIAFISAFSAKSGVPQRRFLLDQTV
jgi:hypothetical protein